MALLQKQEKEEEKCKNTVMWVLAIIGAVAAVAGIVLLVVLHTQCTVFSHRIIWKTLKMISMMILTITLKMKITKKIKM